MLKSDKKMTELCQLEGHPLKRQLVYFGPKVDYFFATFFKISTLFFLPIIYIKIIDRQTKLEVNRTQNDHFSLQNAL